MMQFLARICTVVGDSEIGDLGGENSEPPSSGTPDQNQEGKEDGNLEK